MAALSDRAPDKEIRLTRARLVLLGAASLTAQLVRRRATPARRAQRPLGHHRLDDDPLHPRRDPHVRARAQARALVRSGEGTAHCRRVARHRDEPREHLRRRDARGEPAGEPGPGSPARARRVRGAGRARPFRRGRDLRRRRQHRRLRMSCSPCSIKPPCSRTARRPASGCRKRGRCTASRPRPGTCSRSRSSCARSSAGCSSSAAPTSCRHRRATRSKRCPHRSRWPSRARRSPRTSSGSRARRGSPRSSRTPPTSSSSSTPTRTCGT